MLKKNKKINYQNLLIEWLESIKLKVKATTFIHYQQLIYQHIIPILGIYKVEELTTKQIAELSTAYISASNKLNINPSIVDKYLWEIGNQYCNKHNCTNCPLVNNCLTKTNKIL